MMRRISTIVIMLMFVAAGSYIWLTQAQASQGPGVTPGTASVTAQFVMAIAVYGGSAVLLAVGLIGAAWQRKVRS